MTSINSSLKNWNETKKKRDSFEMSGYLNLPDLQFYLWCQRNYKLNKGVYNTIDNWFYEFGVENILLRRLYLLAFLDFAKPDQEEGDHKFIRFGHGGLTRKLLQFTTALEKEKGVHVH